jgi:L-iditol 2-dehydrogenase
MNEAVFFHGARDVRVAPINLREGGPDETLIDVAAVGICGSDLHYYKDGGIGSAVIREPFIPGHEFGGRLCETYLNSDLGEARSSLLIQIDLADDASGVFRVIAICARTLNSSARPI